jgi:hypothetical protein
MGFFRGRAGEDREKAAAELVTEQARAVKAQPVVAGREQPVIARREQPVVAGREQPVVARREQPVVVGREVKREARPDPNKPGWGRAID